MKNLLKKLKSYIKNWFHSIRSSFKTEDDYYEDLFVKNPSWNTTNPNSDEKNRWTIIRSFINDEFKERDLTILDLGCGRGWMTNLLNDYGNVIGVEPVEKVVEYGKTLYPNITFEVGTIETILAMGKASGFDLIVSSEVIEHIADGDKSDFVDNISRLLKPNGCCIISTPRAEIQKAWMEESRPSQPIEDWLTELELNELFIANNFKREKLDHISLRGKKSQKIYEVYQVCLFKKIPT